MRMESSRSARAGSVSAVQRLDRTPHRRTVSAKMGASIQTPKYKTYSSIDVATATITSVGHILVGMAFQKRPVTAARKNTPATPARNVVTILLACPGSPPAKPTMGLESAPIYLTLSRNSLAHLQYLTHFWRSQPR